MSVLVYAENWDGQFKKSTFEAVSYGKAVADLKGTDLVVLSIGNVGNDELGQLANYGASKILSGSGADHFDGLAWGAMIHQVAGDNGCDTIVVSGTWNGRAIAPVLGVKMDAAVVSDVCEVPSSASPLVVKKKGFSGKAFINVEVKSSSSILILSPNSFGVKESAGTADIQSTDVSTSEKSGLNHKEYQKESGKVSLTEAEIVVSAGRGLKGPENWGMIEDLASQLEAATACSKPVSDIGWRPHHEHVGQTGITVAPNLYIATGISGAIQHLAGVSSSKCIVVINNDSEAPFFKAADYGIVGDAFDVVPQLVEAIKEFKAGGN